MFIHGNSFFSLILTKFTKIHSEMQVESEILGQLQLFWGKPVNITDIVFTKNKCIFAQRKEDENGN